MIQVLTFSTTMSQGSSYRSLSHLVDIALTSNKEVKVQINNLTRTEHGDEQIREVIVTLCLNMVRLNNYQGAFMISESMMIDFWMDCISTIEALMNLPHPHSSFITARMLLYLGSQIHQSVGKATVYSSAEKAETGTADLCKLCIKLDDALLEPLKEIWKTSKDSEDFKWIFVDDRLHGKPFETIISDSDLKVAQALSPLERARLSKEDGAKFYYRKATDNEEDRLLYKDPMPRWDCGQEDTDNFVWTTEGSDGPIRLEIPYAIGREDDDSLHVEKSIPMFRRSKQFCLDARQIFEAKQSKQVRHILDQVYQRHKVPPEVQVEILGYLQHREPFPYLQKLDLSAAYAPFPTVGEPCGYCEGTSGWLPLKRTCPNSSIYIWNLPLRRFHVLHQNEFRSVSLCAYGAECTGHHDTHDREWAVGRDPEFTLFIEQELAKINNEFISLDQAGLGPVRKIRLDTREDDMARQRRLLSHDGIYQDSSDDWQMYGGLGGLIDCMVHGRVLVGAWPRGIHYNDGGIATKPAQWALGRKLSHQRRAEQAIMNLHSWPGRCEWCYRRD